jgi:MYXO-CTERM domain-containing protein
MLTKLLAATVLVLGTSTAALAAPMYSFTGFQDLSGPADFAQATTIQTNAPIVIDQIGIWAQTGVLTQNHALRIRDLTNNVDLFNGVILAGTGTLVDGFRYIDIANIAVGAGVRLAVMSDNRTEPNTDLMAFDLTGLTFNPSVTLLGSSFTNFATVANFPFGDFGSNVIAGANLLINTPAAVPHPGALALLVLGGVFGLARSRFTRRG